jgi:hypothetical protein
MTAATNCEAAPMKMPHITLKVPDVLRIAFSMTGVRKTTAMELPRLKKAALSCIPSDPTRVSIWHPCS